jgi:hypothetical protein
MICIWCSRCWRSPIIFPFLSEESRAGSISLLPARKAKLAELVATGALKIGAIHTYLELYARMLVDLTPRVALVVADKADREGNLYAGPNTEDAPTIAVAAAFRGGIVVAQVSEIVGTKSRNCLRSWGFISACRFQAGRRPIWRTSRSGLSQSSEDWTNSNYPYDRQIA